MSFLATRIVGAAILGAASVAAHGYVKAINVAGTYYDGYNPTTDPYMSDPPTVVGWTASDTDEGFVSPSAYASGDIICHVDAKPAGGYATAKAGDKIELYWTAWPSSHKGPVLDYLAKCADDDCVNVDKTSLEFFKIDGVGLVSDTDVPGTWASDNLISNNNSWIVEIPSTLASGNYVLRHEIIALHSAEESDGAQNYPQCFNLAITGTGTLEPTGTLGEALYSESEAGILVDIYQTLTSYDIPGPTMIAAGTNLAQSAISVTASVKAVTDISAATSAAATSAAATSAAATSAAASTSAAAASTTAAATSAAAATTSAAAASSSVAATTSSVAAEATTSAASAATTSAAKTCKKRRHARDVLRA
ncbi:Endoglucanase-4 [Cytospora mali]|uniref:lytic cellulose monooxygenase (C4-dehydrogenating) n=1 Tax=Cytospora mali TaxID=578113 RepID=A0A194W0S2_CYTMA|nr:Endoglucanase-4 [Valsa mali]